MSRNHRVVETLRADPRFAALHRSLEFYYGDPEHTAAMDAFYSRFVARGDLVFDIGSHVGDRVGSLEPGKDADITIFTGDPLRYTSRVRAVIAAGKVVYGG